MKLTLVRHGETVENKALLLQGQKDGTLSKTGLKQISKVARKLRNEHFDVAYTSDLRRARQTCEKILEYHPGVEMHLSEKLRERHFGELEGRLRTDYYQMVEKSGLSFDLFQPPGGESFQEVLKRALSFVLEIHQKHHDQHVLIVSHGGIIGTLSIHYMNENLAHIRRFIPENTGVSRVELNGESQPKLLVFNETDHLNSFRVAFRRMLRNMSF